MWRWLACCKSDAYRLTFSTHRLHRQDQEDEAFAKRLATASPSPDMIHSKRSRVPDRMEIDEVGFFFSKPRESGLTACFQDEDGRADADWRELRWHRREPINEVPWASRYRDRFQAPPFFAPPMRFAMAEPEREMTYEEMLALDDRVQKKTKVRAERLPSFEWRHDAEATKAMEPCSICLESFERGQTICILPCTHRFHTTELVQWFETSGKSTCPVCNVDVNDAS